MLGAVAVVANVVGQHDVAEVGVRGVFPDEPAWFAELNVRTTKQVRHVQVSAPGVEMPDDTGQQSIESDRVELGEPLLPLDQVRDTGSVHAEGVVHWPASASRIGVEDQRAFCSQYGRKCFLSITGTVEGSPAAIIGDGFVEQLVL